MSKIEKDHEAQRETSSGAVIGKRQRRTRAKDPHGRSLYRFPKHDASLGVLLLPPGRDASPSQGSPPAVCRWHPFIHLGEERQSGVKFLVLGNNATGEA